MYSILQTPHHIARNEILEQYEFFIKTIKMINISASCGRGAMTVGRETWRSSARLPSPSFSPNVRNRPQREVWSKIDFNWATSPLQPPEQFPVLTNTQRCIFWCIHSAHEQEHYRKHVLALKVLIMQAVLYYTQWWNVRKYIYLSPVPM